MFIRFLLAAVFAPTLAVVYDSTPEQVDKALNTVRGVLSSKEIHHLPHIGHSAAVFQAKQRRGQVA